ncbi:MAG: triose-phosphate isomerase [bacterium]
MKNLVVANWKMNLDISQSVNTVLDIIKQTKKYLEKNDLVICPSYLAIPEVREALANTSVEIGAQNCSWEEEGALTGEVSPKVLQKYCQYIILGHSERRMYLYETSDIIARKIDLVTNLGIKPIVCIGETQEEHDRGDISRIIYEVGKAFSLVEKEKASDVVIAYEPIWAISTSVSHTDNKVTCDYAGRIAQKIREEISRIYNQDIAKKIRIIYGGSVNSKNIELLHCQPDIQGYLIGSASLDPLEMKKIFESIS